MKDRRRIALVALATTLYAGAFPPFGYELLAFFVGLPLGLLVLDPRHPLSAREACVTGFVFGEVTTLAVGGHWLYLAAHEFFGKSAMFSGAFTLVTTITHAGIFIGAAVALSAALIRVRSIALRVMAFAAVWVSFELLRARLLYGCPWDFLGHALYRRPLLMQAASFGGAYVLSWLCLAAGASLAMAVQATTPRGRALGVAAAATIPIAMMVYGSIRTGGSDRVGLRAPLTVGLVQANVGRHELWDVGRRADHLERLISLSRSPELAGANLLIWAENAVPFLLDADVDARRRIHALAHELGAYVLTGAPRSEASSDGHARFFNSVYLFAPDGVGLATYDKTRLLPYVEATPSWSVSRFLRANGTEYVPGTEHAIFDVDGWKVAPLVCFESTYPEITRTLAVRGADLFVNVSNDSWFDRGAAPAQHFGMSVLRTVENHVPLVRVANTGVSAVVDADGRIVGELPQRQPAVARYRVDPSAASGTVYTWIGDAFAWGCVAAALVSLLWCLRPGCRA